jgi:hypothetical protein
LPLALLAACNMVSGPRSDFGKGADASQRLRPGFWTTRCFEPTGDRGNCRLHQHRFTVSGTSIGPYPSENIPDESDMNDPRPGADLALVYAIVPVEPILMEWAPADPHGVVEDTFLYTTIEPAARDAEGRITRLKLWPVWCGPPKNGGRMTLNNTDNDDQWVSRKPLPGLRMNGKFCTAANDAAIRDAAHKARNDPPLEAYWVSEKPQ